MSFLDWMFLVSVIIVIVMVFLKYRSRKNSEKIEVESIDMKAIEKQAQHEKDRANVWELPVCDFVSEIVEDIWANSSKYSVSELEWVTGWRVGAGYYRMSILRESTELVLHFSCGRDWIDVSTNMGPVLNERERIELATACKYVYDWHTRNAERIRKETEQRQRDAVIAQIRKEKQDGAAS